MGICSTLRIFCLAVLIVITEGGCSNESFMDVQSKHVLLIGGIQSYQSLASFEAMLAKTTYRWTVRDDGPRSGGGHPPFHAVSVTIDNYLDMGLGGKLLVNLFNDRLMDTVFYPNSFDDYSKKLIKLLNVTSLDQESIKLSPYASVSAGTDHSGARYVKWEDTRLSAEFNLWIRRYT